MEDYSENGLEYQNQYQEAYDVSQGFSNGDRRDSGSTGVETHGNDAKDISRSGSTPADPNDRPRTKRTRATGEALIVLKREFDENPNPNAQNRKRISEITGLPEKNVRIWFQNRRAKHRKSDRGTSGSGGGPNSSSTMATNNNNGNSDVPAATDMNAATNAAYPAADFDRISLEANPNYCFLDVKSLTVGTWKRLKSGNLKTEELTSIKSLSNLSPFSINEIMANATDLMVLISKKNHEINYFFSAIANNTKILFRIFFPINTVVDCSVTASPEDLPNLDNDDDDEGHVKDDVRAKDKLYELRLNVTKSPTFAVYFSDGVDQYSSNQWSICEDFSEGRQVSEAFIGGSNIPHVITGLEESLNFMNATIQDYNGREREITHRSQDPMNASDTQPLILHPEPHAMEQQQQPFFDDFNDQDGIYGMGEQNNSQFVSSSTAQPHSFAQHSTTSTGNDNVPSQFTDSNVPRTPDFLKSEMGNEEQSGLNNLLIFEDQNNANTKNVQNYF
ncbi:LANO_0G09098g1_1 [Lachancea nothofagi CBS 11611]|uniref:LANO_0G09098g1_1 n=1 Tax=Lachancea nothofagi CBS 11611 TaxID=1266666 RepID=A0A1G4KIL2_9SACH|nr:LANO_0G09098g1_1 [Lachancea nothofagi CBS 11611]